MDSFDTGKQVGGFLLYRQASMSSFSSREEVLAELIS